MGLPPRTEIVLALALLLTSLPAGAAATIYCCEVGGQTQCGDVLPHVCYGQPYREISPQGTVRLSAEELARRRAEEERRRDEVARAARSRRALLETYQSVEDLDRRRDRALGELDREIADLRVRENELLKRRSQLAADSGGGGGREMQEQDDALRDLDGELAAHRSVIDAKRREYEAIRQRYENDRKRYIELTSPGLQAPR